MFPSLADRTILSDNTFASKNDVVEQHYIFTFILWRTALHIRSLETCCACRIPSSSIINNVVKEGTASKEVGWWMAVKGSTSFLDAPYPRMRACNINGGKRHVFRGDRGSVNEVARRLRRHVSHLTKWSYRYEWRGLMSRVCTREVAWILDVSTDILHACKGREAFYKSVFKSSHQCQKHVSVRRGRVNGPFLRWSLGLIARVYEIVGWRVHVLSRRCAAIKVAVGEHDPTCLTCERNGYTWTREFTCRWEVQVQCPRIVFEAHALHEIIGDRVAIA